MVLCVKIDEVVRALPRIGLLRPSALSVVVRAVLLVQHPKASTSRRTLKLTSLLWPKGSSGDKVASHYCPKKTYLTLLMIVSGPRST